MLWSAKCSLFLRYPDQSFVCTKKLYFTIDTLYKEPHAVHRTKKNIFLNLQYSTACCDALRSLRTVLTTLNTKRCVTIFLQVSWWRRAFCVLRKIDRMTECCRVQVCSWLWTVCSSCQGTPPPPPPPPCISFTTLCGFWLSQPAHSKPSSLAPVLSN